MAKLDPNELSDRSRLRRSRGLCATLLQSQVNGQVDHDCGARDA
jgi:hypothetical protein